MKFTLWQFLLLLLLLLISSCEKEENISPILFTGQADRINENEVILIGNFKNIDPDKTKSFGFLVRKRKNGKPDINNFLTKTQLTYNKEKEVYTSVYNIGYEDSSAYYVVTFVEYPSKAYYGNLLEIKNTFENPQILDVVPPEAFLGDTVKIKTKYPGEDPDQISIFFNETEAEIINLDSMDVFVKVPVLPPESDYYKTDQIKVRLKRKNTYSGTFDDFNIKEPEFISFANNIDTVYSGGTYDIMGRGFHNVNLDVFLGDVACKVITAGIDKIKIVIPPVLDQSGKKELKIFYGNDKVLNTDHKVVLDGLSIQNVTPEEVFTFEELTVTGNQLGTVAFGYFIGNEKAEVIYSVGDTVILKVPGNLCGNEFPLILKSEDFPTYSYTYDKNIKFKQPDNLNLTIEQNDYYNASFNLTGDFFPIITYPNATSFIINEITTGFSQYDSSDKKTRTITAQMIPDLETNDGIINISFKFCDDVQISYESVMDIPAPQISNYHMDVVLNYATLQIEGSNFNAFPSIPSHYNKVIINSQKYVEPVQVEGNKLVVNFDISRNNFQYEESYPLQVYTNGQVSNTINMLIPKQTWEIAANKPRHFHSLKELFFFQNDSEIYLGAGAFNSEKYLMSYSFDRDTWKVFSKSPEFNKGSTASDNDYAYVLDFDDFYRYDIYDDSWTTMPSVNNDTTSTTYSCFIHEGSFYAFSYLLHDFYYKYDIVTNDWTIMEGYNDISKLSLEEQLSGTKVGNKAYLFGNNKMIVYDFSTQSFISNFTLSSSLQGNRSEKGVFFNNNIYFISGSELVCFDLEGNLIDRYILPTGDNGFDRYVFIVNNSIYICNDESIWKLNL